MCYNKFVAYVVVVFVDNDDSRRFFAVCVRVERAKLATHTYT